MSLDHFAVQQGAAEPWTARSSAHDQAQMQRKMHAECAEQGTLKASLDLESPLQDSHAQTPSSDLGAGSLLPRPAIPAPPAPRNVVDAHQSQAAAGVTSDAQTSAAIPIPARTMNGEEKLYQGKTFNSSLSEGESVA